MSYSELPTLRGNLASNAKLAKPAVVIGAGAGAGAAVTASSGCDQWGSVTFTSAGTPAAGVLLTVTFGTPYAVAPVVSIDAADARTAACQLYAVATTTTLTISANAAISVGTGCTVNYVVVGGA